LSTSAGGGGPGGDAPSEVGGAGSAGRVRFRFT
jgi:hypothetical protein